MKHFEKWTREKAAGRRRLLLVDGHNSHCTHGFLEYARQHNISVLCYPSHSTHLYQGLDVVIFAPLKKAWSAARDDHERETGQSVDKKSFLRVYAKAHKKAFTMDNICAAFRKTGVVPFNPDVIPEDALAPSQTTATAATTYLPLELESPARHMYDAMHACLARSTDQTTTGAATPSRQPPIGVTPIRRAVSSLANGSGRHLITNSPIRASVPVPLYKPTTISPIRTHYPKLLDVEPKTECEAEFKNALGDMNRRLKASKEQMVGMQATQVLQNNYCQKANQRLHAHEEHVAKKAKKTYRIMSGGAHLLTNDELIAGKAQAETAAAEKAAVKAANKAKRSAYARKLEKWKKEEEQRQKRLKVAEERYQRDLALWEIERARAKKEKRRPRWTKPKRQPRGSGVPRPKMKSMAALDEDEEADSGSDGQGYSRNKIPHTG